MAERTFGAWALIERTSDEQWVDGVSQGKLYAGTAEADCPLSRGDQYSVKPENASFTTLIDGPVNPREIATTVVAAGVLAITQKYCRTRPIVDCKKENGGASAQVVELLPSGKRNESKYDFAEIPQAEFSIKTEE